MHNYRISLDKLKSLLFIVLCICVYILSSCIPVKVNSGLISTGTPTEINLPTTITLTPTPTADLPQKDQDLIDLNLLDPGEYIVIRDEWAGEKMLYM